MHPDPVRVLHHNRHPALQIDIVSVAGCEARSGGVNVVVAILRPEEICQSVHPFTRHTKSANLLTYLPTTSQYFPSFIRPLISSTSVGPQILCIGHSVNMNRSSDENFSLP